MMKRMVRVRILSLIAALLLVFPQGLALAGNGGAPELPPATLSDANRGPNGTYTGKVTLIAPAGYEISIAADGTFAPTADADAPSSEGECYGEYYLRATDGQATVYGPYYIAYTYDATGPVIIAGAIARVLDALQVTLTFSEPARAAVGGAVTLQREDKVYTAALGDSDAAGGASLSFSLPASRFIDAGSTPADMTAGTEYTLAVTEGSFCDAAGNRSAAVSAVTVSVPEEGEAVVVHSLHADMGWSLVVVADGAETELESGGTVAVNTVVKAVASANVVNPCTFAIYSGGQPVSGADLTQGYTVTADTEILSQPSPLKGTVAIAGKAEYGQSLTAAFQPGAGGAAPSDLTYVWKSGDKTVLVNDGAAASPYPLTEADIGKTLTVTASSPWCTGSAAASTGSVAKATSTAPGTPTLAEQTNTSVRLTPVDGCEYRMDQGSWQTDPSFSGLSQGQTYSFYQRYRETGTKQASPASAALTVGTVAALTGTVTISGDARVQSTVQANVSGTNNTGALAYSWKRGTQTVSDAQTYTIQAADINQSITVQVTSSVQTGAISASTPVIAKATQAAPAAPIMAGNTSTSITLMAVSGCEYSSNGVNWQDSPTFGNLAAGRSYTFYQRYKETATASASPLSLAAALSTAADSTFTGTLRADGQVRYGKTLVASFTGTGYTGGLTYLWYRGANQVGTGQTYDVSANDIGNPIYVRVVNSAYNSITQLVGVAQKAEYVGTTPPAPTRASRTTSKITLTAIDGYEYSKDGTNWQTSAVFSGLKEGTSYKFYQRVKATDTIEASPASKALSTSTSSSGSSDSGGSSGSGGSGGDSDSGSPDTTPSVTALTSYSLTGGNTRILFSTMESLATGNKTQPVTIYAGSVEYEFAAGTMQLTAGKLWYDFGAQVNGCTHQEAAAKAAGDHFISLVHYNMDGNLPAKAAIRISLGAEHAGKTLYYYKFTPTTGVLSFMQTAIVDATGWVTVEQSSCSDYVFLDADINAVAPLATTTPAATPFASPTPVALVDEPGSTDGFDGWLVVIIVLIALLLIVVGVLMYLKNKNERGSLFDDDDDMDYMNEGFDDYDAEYDDEYYDGETDQFADEYGYQPRGLDHGADYDSGYGPAGADVADENCYTNDDAEEHFDGNFDQSSNGSAYPRRVIPGQRRKR